MHRKCHVNSCFSYLQLGFLFTKIDVDILWYQLLFFFSIQTVCFLNSSKDFCILWVFFTKLYWWMRTNNNQGFVFQSTINRCAQFCLQFLWSWIRFFMMIFPMRLTLSWYSETGRPLESMNSRFGFKRQWPKQSFGTVFLGIFGLRCPDPHSILVFFLNWLNNLFDKNAVRKFIAKS